MTTSTHIPDEQLAPAQPPQPSVKSEAAEYVAMMLSRLLSGQDWDTPAPAPAVVMCAFDFTASLIRVVTTANSVPISELSWAGSVRGAELAENLIRDPCTDVCCLHCAGLALSSLAGTLAQLLHSLHGDRATAMWNHIVLGLFSRPQFM